MRTIAIPQLYCGASGKKGAYNRQEVGLARAFAALGCRAVVLYPDPDAAPEAVTSEDLEPNVRIYYVPARKAGVSAFYRTWQPLLNEHVDTVHVMGDNALGVPGLYRFCRDHDIFFYSQLGAIKSTSENPVMRAVIGPFVPPQPGYLPQNPHLCQNPRRGRPAGTAACAMRRGNARWAGYRHHPQCKWGKT